MIKLRAIFMQEKDLLVMSEDCSRFIWDSRGCFLNLQHQDKIEEERS